LAAAGGVLVCVLWGVEEMSKNTTSHDELMRELNKSWRFRLARVKAAPGWWLYEMACRYKKWFELRGQG